MNIFLCGDVMTGRGIDQILRFPLPSQIYEGYVKDAREYVALAENESGKIPRGGDDGYIWGDALKIWEEKKPDLKIINLETAVTNNGSFLPKGINYRMNPKNVSVLSKAGIDICVLANNHLLDWDHQGLEDTISILDKVEIKHTGAGKTLKEACAPAIFEHQEGRVLVFAMGLPSSGIPPEWEATANCPGVFFLNDLSAISVQKVRDIIKKYRQPDDLIIASIHWGSNWGHEISERQREFARSMLVRAGVDIIHGHSSHHPRAIEIYQGRPIFYGCGDFINDYEGIKGHDEFRSDLTLMYFIDCQIGSFRLRGISMNCLQMNRFRLRRASAEDRCWMLENLNEISAPFFTGFSLSKQGEIVVEI